MDVCVMENGKMRKDIKRNKFYSGNEKIIKLLTLTIEMMT